MTVKLVSTASVSAAHGVKACIYGRSGVGKTYLVRTAPNPVIIMAEAGMLSLRDVQLPMIAIKTVEDLTEVHQWAERSAEARQFNTLYIDSISEIAEIVLANAKKLVKDPRQAYGELIDKMIMTIKAFRDLVGYNVVMTAKQEYNKDEHTGISTYGPSMPGSKLGQQMPYLFDEVFRLGIAKNQKGEQYRFLQTSPDPQYEAKDRSGSLQPVEPPDLGAIFNKILPH